MCSGWSGSHGSVNYKHCLRQKAASFQHDLVGHLGLVLSVSPSDCSEVAAVSRAWASSSAVVECADAAHGLGGHIIADGGITCPGDCAKAFGAGADFERQFTEFERVLALVRALQEHF